MASCSVCLLPTLAAVNRALAEGAVPIAILARRHNVSRQALSRHKAEHLAQALVEATSEASAEHGSALVAELRDLKATLTGLLDLAREKGDLRGATGVVRETSRVVELIGRMEGALTPPPALQVNLHQSIEFQTVIGTVIEALTPFPEARGAVVMALQVH